MTNENIFTIPVSEFKLLKHGNESWLKGTTVLDGIPVFIKVYNADHQQLRLAPLRQRTYDACLQRGIPVVEYYGDRELRVYGNVNTFSVFDDLTKKGEFIVVSHNNSDKRREPINVTNLDEIRSDLIRFSHQAVIKHNSGAEDIQISVTGFFLQIPAKGEARASLIIADIGNDVCPYSVIKSAEQSAEEVKVFFNLLAASRFSEEVLGVGPLQLTSDEAVELGLSKNIDKINELLRQNKRDSFLMVKERYES